METNELYLSLDINPVNADFVIKLHTDPCFIRWTKKEIVKRSIAFGTEESLAHTCMRNIHNIAEKIYDLLREYSLAYETRNNCIATAYRIAIEYFEGAESPVMWNITFIKFPEKCETASICECCGMCDDEEDEDDQISADWHINHIYDNLCEMKYTFENHENRLNDLEKENIMLKSNIISVLNELQYSGDNKQC